MRRAALPLLTFLLWALGASPAGAIVGGQPVPAGQRPYVANVLIQGQLACTGSLIAPTWVLTAGHCASISGGLSNGQLDTPVLYPASSLSVRLGTVQSDGTGGTAYAIKRVLVNPGFSFVNGAYTYDNALLELDGSSKITPIQVAGPTERAIWEPGQPVVEVGFGTTSEDSSDKPPAMRQVTVQVVSDQACAAIYPFNPVSSATLDGEFDAKVHVCAGVPEGGKDVCEGDSGGPLLAATADGGVRIVGTTSTGNGCARPGYPSIFGRVGDSPMRDWIASIVPGSIGSSAPAVGLDQLAASPRRFRPRAAGGVLLAGSRSAGGTQLTFRSSAPALVAVRLLRGTTVLAHAHLRAAAGANHVLLTGRHVRSAGHHAAIAPGPATLQLRVEGQSGGPSIGVRVLRRRRA